MVVIGDVVAITAVDGVAGVATTGVKASVADGREPLTAVAASMGTLGSEVTVASMVAEQSEVAAASTAAAVEDSMAAVAATVGGIAKLS